MFLLNHSHILIISDASIKNNVAISITYIYVYDRPIVKMIYHAANVTSTEAELFIIRCGINQAINLPGISKIIIVTDSIHAVKKIFDSAIHSFQVYLAAIFKELRNFFIVNNNNSIVFWECPSQYDWPLFKSIDRDTKQFQQTLLLLCKLSWDFSKKSECDNIIQNWKMTFQASDQKGQQFLELVDDDDNPIKLFYINRGSWLKFIDYSNSLCARVTRAIINHAPTDECRLHFFLKEDFKCLCRLYSIESRCYILHKCQRFNNYWNLRRDSLSYFILFLEFNSSAFAFNNAIR